jgi:hypothetical protein
VVVVVVIVIITVISITTAIVVGKYSSMGEKFGGSALYSIRNYSLGPCQSPSLGSEPYS